MPGPHRPQVDRIVGQGVRILDHRGLYSALTGTAEPPHPATRSMFAGFPLDLAVVPDLNCSWSPFNSGGLFRCFPSGPVNTTLTLVGVTS